MIKINHNSKSQQYLRYFISVVFLLLPLFSVLANPSDHGRYSDLSDDYTPSNISIVIPLLILIGLGGFFLFFWLKDVWAKNKESIQSALGIIAFIAIVAFVGKCTSENYHNSPKDSQYQYVQPTQSSQPNSYKQPIQVPSYTPQLKYRTEYYEERCERCYGTGHIACDRCNGRGYVENTCPECKGYGYTTVTKYNIEYNDPLDFMSGVKCKTPYTEKIYCFHCHGSGKVTSSCPKCGVDNSYTPSIILSTITCPSCNGQGIIKRSRHVSYYE